MKQWLAAAVLVLFLAAPSGAGALLTSTDSIEVVTSSTAGIDYTVSWADVTATAFTPGTSTGAISSIGTTTVLAAPSASTYRSIRTLTLHNTHASTANTINVQMDVSATNRLMYNVTLAAGESLVLDEEGRFHYYSTLGVEQLSSTAFTGIMPVANGGTGLSTHTQGAIATAGGGTVADVDLTDVATGSILASGGTSTIPRYLATGIPINGVAPQLTLGAASASSSGRIDFLGSTSGTTQLTVPAAAGSVTQTLPTVATTGPTANPSSTGQPLTATTAGVQSYGTLGVVGGGTGLATTTTGAIITGGNGTANMVQLADVAVGSALVSGGTSTIPAWSAASTCTSSAATTCTIASQRSGCLPVCSMTTSVSTTFRAAIASTTITCTFGTSGTNTCNCICF